MKKIVHKEMLAGFSVRWFRGHKACGQKVENRVVSITYCPHCAREVHPLEVAEMSETKMNKDEVGKK